MANGVVPFTPLKGQAPKKSGGGGGFLSGVEHALGSAGHEFAHIGGNLVHDITSTARGIPQGLVDTVEHPIRTAENFGKVEYHSWAPLFTGHFSQWAHQFADHPLGPLLDVAALLSGGAGLAARGLASPVVAAASGAREAELLAAAGDTSRLTSLGKLGKLSIKAREIRAGEPRILTAKTFGKHGEGLGNPLGQRFYSRRPLANIRQHATDQLGQSMAVKYPKWWGTGGKIRDLTVSAQHERFLQHDTQFRGFAADATKRNNANLLAKKFKTLVKAGQLINDHLPLAAKAIDVQIHSGIMDMAHAMSRDMLRREVKVGKDGTRVVNYKLAPGYGFVLDPKYLNHFYKPESLPKNLESAHGWLLDVRKRHMTNDFHLAAKNDKGEYLVAPLHTARRWGREAANSTTLLHTMWMKPRRVWKWAVLASRPGYLVNNAVGNSFMYLTEYGGAGAARGLLSAMKQMHGADKAAKDMEWAAGRIPQRPWLHKYYLDALSGFSQDAIKQITGGKTAGVRAKLATGFYGVTNKYADMLFRGASVSTILRRHPEVQSLMKTVNPATGRRFTFDQAAELASRNPTIRNAVKHEVDQVMGDYHHLTKTEKLVRNAVPFYTWDRAILRHSVHMRPTAQKALQLEGQQGAQHLQNSMGQIPDFLMNSVLLGHAAGGRQGILATTGLNPYSTLADLADTGTALAGSNVNPAEAIGQQIDPFMRSGIEQIVTHQNMLTGAPAPRPTGVPPLDIVVNALDSTPPVTLALSALRGTPKTTYNKRTHQPVQHLFKRDRKQYALGFAGVPIKSVNLQQAHYMAAKQQGKKTKKTAMTRPVRIPFKIK